MAASLGIAFNSTFVALFVSLVLMLFSSMLQGREERLAANCKHFVSSQLIARLSALAKSSGADETAASRAIARHGGQFGVKRPFTTRSAPGFGLAFLDVLCCGLGSAVLLLLIVKHGPADAGTIDQASIDAQTRDVQERLAVEESHRDGLLARLAEQERVLARDAAALESLSAQQQAQAARYAGLLDQLRSERATLRENAASLQALQSTVKQPEEPESRPYSRQLTGINIADDRVAIFLDRSASMLHSSLVEIVRLRVSSPALKRSARKWAAAREAARWAYRQMPDGTRFRFFTYAGEPQGHRRRNAHPPGKGFPGRSRGVPARTRMPWTKPWPERCPTGPPTSSRFSRPRPVWCRGPGSY